MSKFLISLKQLDQWFYRQKRVLPWRDNPTVYRVWISEIMLQQTQVATVIPFFEKFIARFPSVEALAAAAEEEVLLYWSGLGYYSRARNLHKSAKKIVELGRFPRNREEWLALPGVGNYTAGAILSIASNEPEAILDGNVERVLSRVRRVSRQKGDQQFKIDLWSLSENFIQNAYKNGIKPSNFNQALMELGATLCSPKKPKCGNCPLIEICEAHQMGEEELYPPRKKPKKWVAVEENLHCVLSSTGQVLLRQRKAGEWRNGLWDLLEQDPKGLYRKAELVGEVKTRHIVTTHKIQRMTKVWRVNSSRSPLSAAEPTFGETLRWISVENPEVAVGSALKRTLKEVQNLLGFLK